jgi:hypothetical protein
MNRAAARRFRRHAGVRARPLAALADAGHDIPLVLTQPDRPAGRGMKLQPSPVKQEALQRGLPLIQPRSLRLDGKFPDDAAARRRRWPRRGSTCWWWRPTG